MDVRDFLMDTMTISPEDRHGATDWLGLPEGFPLRPAIIEAISDPRSDLSGWPAETVETVMGLGEHDREQVLTFAAFM